MEETSYGRRLFINVIDDIARTDPSRRCLSIPHYSSNPQGGWKKISFGQYANAINRLSHWIVDRVGPSPEGQFPTCAYIGPNDIRYYIFVAAAAKCRIKILFISPRNHKDAQLSLFDATDCKWIFYAPEFGDLVQVWTEERDIASAVVEDADSVLRNEKVPEFPYNKNFEEAQWDPYMVLHTSGSTGIPKPITCRHGMIALSDSYHNQATWNGYSCIAKGLADRTKTLYCPMPLYHALGIYVFISLTVYWNTPLALGCAETPVTPDTVVEGIKYSSADAAILPPSTLAEMSHSAEYIETLKSLSCVTTGGGALEPEAGDRLVEAGVVFQSVISSTEYGFYPVYWQPQKGLWRYFIFNNDLFGCEYRDMGNNAYEQVVVRNDKNSTLQGVFYTFPDSNVFETKDLYQPHPTLENHWLHRGRIDDVIVFSNGEKLNPVTIEAIVGDHPEIKRAVVVGQGKFQAAMILEPVHHPIDEESRSKLLEQVWQLVQEANKQTVAHGQIARHMVILSDPDVPFPYSGKGSLQRIAMLQLYNEKIESLYSKYGIVEAPALDFTSSETLMQSIIDIFQKSIGLSNVKPETDFFQHGLDSLQVINVTRNLNVSLEILNSSKKLVITHRDLYGNPTPRLLSTKIYLHYFGNGGHKEHTEHTEQIMQDILDKQIESLPEILDHQRPGPSEKGQTVLLSGSTGGLGSYILDQIESTDSIKRVICFNRGEDGGRSKQTVVNKKRGLRASFSKAEFVHADFSKPYLGLEETLYNQLLDSTDCVIHCAWSVNFNHTVQTFEPQIRGTANLLKFASQTKKHIPIVFVSSIGSVDCWKEPGPIPETHLPDFSLASNGYGQSKLLSSSILHYGMEQLNLPSKILRVGQIAGPRSEFGEWNPTEWLPIIVASSVQFGLLPGDLGLMEQVEWMPIEDVASAVLEISGVASSHSSPLEMTGYFNVVNPSPANWADLAPAVQEFYSKRGISVKIVEFSEWINAVEGIVASGNSSNPAVKLLDTFRSFVSDSESAGLRFSVDRSKIASSTLNNMAPITSEMVQRWCRQWKFEETLPRGDS